MSQNSVELFIVELYNNGSSPYQIAEQLGDSWNHMKVRRILKKMGVKPRDKGEAQANALKTGRAKHPKQKEELA
jgi:hypothetical protein